MITKAAVVRDATMIREQVQSLRAPARLHRACGSWRRALKGRPLLHEGEEPLGGRDCVRLSGVCLRGVCPVGPRSQEKYCEMKCAKP